MGNEPPFFESNPTFTNIVEHWGKARIDVPMQLLARFDDAAKQLIILATFLQGVYFSVFTFGNLKQPLHLVILFFLFISLFSIIVCAAKAVCTVPLKKEAFDTYALFKTSSGLSEAELTNAVDLWCKGIDKIADDKHYWLIRAQYFLYANAFIAALGFPVILYSIM